MDRSRITRYGLVQRAPPSAGAGGVTRYSLVRLTGRSGLGVDRIGALERIAGIQRRREGGRTPDGPDHQRP
jgi:hypothetical protein